MPGLRCGTATRVSEDEEALDASRHHLELDHVDLSLMHWS